MCSFLTQRDGKDAGKGIDHRGAVASSSSKSKNKDNRAKQLEVFRSNMFVNTVNRK